MLGSRGTLTPKEVPKGAPLWGSSVQPGVWWERNGRETLGIRADASLTGTPAGPQETDQHSPSHCSKAPRIHFCSCLVLFLDLDENRIYLFNTDGSKYLFLCLESTPRQNLACQYLGARLGPQGSRGKRTQNETLRSVLERMEGGPVREPLTRPSPSPWDCLPKEPRSTVEEGRGGGGS